VLKLSFNAIGMIIILKYNKIVVWCLMLNCSGRAGNGYPLDSGYPAGTGIDIDPYPRTFMCTDIG
jgi:hypothetical protein